MDVGTAESSPLVDVVVVAYNSGDTLRACVAPLAAAPEIAVVVVDNASPDGGLETVADLDVRTISAPENRGFAAGCNIGWREGRAPAVLFLNPDAQIGPDDVLALAERLRESRAGIVAPRIRDEDGSTSPSIRRFPSVVNIYAHALFLHRVLRRSRRVDEVVRDPRAYEEAHEVDWASGACLLVRRSLLEQLGGLDEGFFMYCEDTDLCRRAWDVGASVVYEPGAIAMHLGGRSAPRASLLPVLAASRCRYAAKHESRVRAVAMRLGIALGAATHALVSSGGRPARRGQLRSLGAAVRPATFRPE